MEKIIEAVHDGSSEIEFESASDLCGSVIRVCDPEDWFDVIEQCKKCGRCV